MGKALGKHFKDFGRNFLKNGVKVGFASDDVGNFAKDGVIYKNDL